MPAVQCLMQAYACLTSTWLSVDAVDDRTTESEVKYIAAHWQPELVCYIFLDYFLENELQAPLSLAHGIV